MVYAMSWHDLVFVGVPQQQQQQMKHNITFFPLKKTNIKLSKKDIRHLIDSIFNKRNANIRFENRGEREKNATRQKVHFPAIFNSSTKEVLLYRMVFILHMYSIYGYIKMVHGKKS